MADKINKTIGAMIAAEPSEESYKEVAQSVATAYYNKIKNGDFTLYRENKYNRNTPDNTEYPTFILLQLTPGEKDWSGNVVRNVTREFMYNNMNDDVLSKHVISTIREIDSKEENLFQDVEIVRGYVPEDGENEVLLSKVDSVMNAEQIRATIGFLLKEDVDNFLESYNNDDSPLARWKQDGKVDHFVYVGE